MSKVSTIKRRVPHAICLILTGVFASVLLAAAGCGKKAPPIPPRQAPLAAVTDLQAAVDGETVTLSWHHSPENHRVAGYLVLRAQTALTQPDCPDCPMVYQKVQTLSVPKSRRRLSYRLTFDQTLPGGFRYTYRIRPFRASGAQGPDSNVVEIEVLPSDRSTEDQ